VLEIDDLRKSYGDVDALNGVSLDVARGEIVALLGPNGAGKTTLVSIVAGLRRADAGAVTVDGIDALARPKEALRRIGLAPQDLGVFPVVKVRHNLELMAGLAGMSRRQAEARIGDVADVLGLTPLLDRLAGSLSGGQKRRLHTAMALVHRPALLLLDEATSGADVQTRSDILDLIKQLAGEGCAVLYSTHYLHEVETLTASVAILDAGRMIARGELDALIGSYGASAVELVFDGPAPALTAPEPVSRNGSVVRIISSTPAVTAAAALAELGPERDRLRSVEIVRPSLESVFLALTGRRYADVPISLEEPAGVPAP
jgi:ABC-2 type transport system ATP-binding protein